MQFFPIPVLFIKLHYVSFERHYRFYPSYTFGIHYETHVVPFKNNNSLGHVCTQNFVIIVLLPEFTTV